jgi:hypothetical protein
VFLVKDSSKAREERIKQFLNEDAALSALLSVIHVEWTLKRAIIALGHSSNVVVRSKLRHCHGLEKYKNVWRDEVNPKPEHYLPVVVRNWQGLGRAFSLRHKLVHGAGSCGGEYATERVNWAIDAAEDIRTFCTKFDVDLDKRLPVRRSSKP